MTAGALISLSRLREHVLLCLLLPAWMLAMGPIQSGISAGQPAMAAVALIVLCIWFNSRGSTAVAGILLGLAMAFKLQLAAPFVVYFFFIRRWRVGTISVFAFGLIAAIALLRLQAANVVWLGDWIENIRRASTNGGPNDFTTANPNRDHLLNLQLPMFAIFGTRLVANLIAAAVTMVLLAVYAIWLARADKRHGTLALIPLAAITLLPVYHRYYDATLLVIPLAWAMSRHRTAAGRLVLVLLLPFFLPVGWATNLLRRGYLSGNVTHHLWWNASVISLQSWIILMLSIILVVIQHRCSDGGKKV
jgi:hypothetical protein